MNMRWSVVAGGLVCLCCESAGAQQCAALQETDRARLIQYVEAKYKVAAGAELAIAETGFVGATCYRKVRFASSDRPNAFRVELIASPDLRFLTKEIMDSNVDPVL